MHSLLPPALRSSSSRAQLRTDFSMEEKREQANPELPCAQKIRLGEPSHDNRITPNRDKKRTNLRPSRSTLRPATPKKATLALPSKKRTNHSVDSSVLRDKKTLLK
ncbi:hypothetical protein PGTUg99_017562 [Puccinia graminis f. sp. tritici]|uniref:Uncharacterized protein n=1 Tax=Puccinia graminis f. sp. tritici TaxID=56615 RepID=A0A5B0RAZ8_PUCGR|nr:hypothetical protein PGTUg99_017562 [Puccinia graminis f. sp. tritici]